MSRFARKTTLVVTLFFIGITLNFAQDTIPSLQAKPKNPDNFWHRVSVGGNLGFQFGTVAGITIAPEGRVRTLDQLYVGFRFVYQYIYDKNYFYDKNNSKYLSYQANVLGGSLYLRYYLSGLFDNFLKNVFAHVEYEYLVYQRPYVQDNAGYIKGADGLSYKPGKDVIQYNSFFVGGGYRQPISSHVSMDFLLLWNINDTYSSPYSNPVFRLGVGVGL